MNNSDGGKKRGGEGNKTMKSREYAQQANKSASKLALAIRSFFFNLPLQ